MRWFNINVLLREKKKSIIIATLPLTLNITKVIKLSGADLYRKFLLRGTGLGVGWIEKWKVSKIKIVKFWGRGFFFCLLEPLALPLSNPWPFHCNVTNLHALQ